MQICTLNKPTDAQLDAQKSLFDYYAELVEQYNNVSVVRINQIDFIIKALGRRDYRDIMLNQDLDTYLKEETICEVCCLYPENFNFEDCEAGIPSALFKEILKFSFLDNEQEQERKQLMNYFRGEMTELHNQINCMINEAFPSLNFEDIENFDMMTALKYLSRAEWILQNLRNFEVNHDPFTGEPWDPEAIAGSHQAMQEEPAIQQEQLNMQAQPKPQKQEVRKPKVELPGANNSFIAGETIEERIERLKRGEIQPKKLTPEKLRELQQNFPEIDWTAQVEEQDFSANIETTPMALRTPDQIYNG